jgi:hypothetical protein
MIASNRAGRSRRRRRRRRRRRKKKKTSMTRVLPPSIVGVP